MMKKFAAMFCLITFATLAQASDSRSSMELDKVMFQVSAKQWVSTQTALLTVNINATLTNADLVQARSDIMSKLAKIADGEWHLTQFDRSQDSSGLEKLSVIAQARVPQASLTSVYQNAKSVSKPGATYDINGIEFKPSLEEIQQIKSQLRGRLYQQVKDEVDRLNKTYAGQNYSVNRLVFFEGEGMPPIEAKAARINMMVMAAPTPSPALTVSNELIMSAMVEAASNRGEGNGSASH